MTGVSSRIARAKISATLLALMMVLSSAIVLTVATDNASALPAGLQEYYTPLPAPLTQDIFDDIAPDNVGDAEAMHYVVGVVSTSDTTTIYYDHWENGYLNGAAGDETITLNKGQEHTFESPNGVPSTNRGTTIYYDGGDRIYTVGGPVQVVVSTWPQQLGTVLADAWEVYPVQAWESGTNAYVIPVGDNLADAPLEYDDFQTVWIQVMSGSNSNSVTVSSSAGTNTFTLNRGEARNIELTGDPGATVSSTYPVQVQIIAGNEAMNVDMRGYSVMPRADWGSSYYAPAPSWSGGYDTDLYIFNPNPTPITIQYQDTSGIGTVS